MQSPRIFHVLPLALALLLACSNKGDTITPEPGSQAPADISDAQPGATAPVGTAPVGRAPNPGPDGVPTNCPVLHDGLCYDVKDACQAAGCTESCSILETYPGRVHCSASADAAPE